MAKEEEKMEVTEKEGGRVGERYKEVGGSREGEEKEEYGKRRGE